ncbi:hypothetical protein [Nocardia sp. NBC_01009]|nr:hypothetical protein OHA42_37985 [Nocardia sp. NBC_01009]
MSLVAVMFDPTSATLALLAAQDAATVAPFLNHGIGTRAESMPART